MDNGSKYKILVQQTIAIVNLDQHRGSNHAKEIINQDSHGERHAQISITKHIGWDILRFSFELGLESTIWTSQISE